MPISVLPGATWLSALSLLPPLAVFQGTLLLGYRARRLLCILLLGIGILSAFVGLSQVAQGPQSALRFFEITNPSEAVGFFANRNHFAALLYSLTLFSAVWVIEAAAGVNRGRLDTAWMAGVAASLFVLVIFLAGQAMARSRAGLVLTIVALFGAFALAVTDRRTVSGGSLAKVTPAKLIMGAIILAIILVVQYALYRILQRFDVDPLEDARIIFARNTFAAAKAYMPLGSGMGTFPSVYALFEKPKDALIDVYANRAHNDVLELALEAGVVGLGLAIVFVAWLATRSVKVWVGRNPTLGGIDLSLARAATLVVGLVIGHSLVDYPLRTGAIMGLLAFACGLLVQPLSVEEKTPYQARVARPRRPSNKERIPAGVLARQLREPPSLGGAEPQPSLADAKPQPSLGDTKPQHAQRWGDDVQWPSEWRTKPEASNRKPTRRGESDS
jgi:O-antigen ligase